MANQTEEFMRYVHAITGQQVMVSDYIHKGLPAYLAQSYKLYSLLIGEEQYLGVLLKDASDFRPATYEKHLAQLFKLVEGGFCGACLMVSLLPVYVRNRLVERGLSFVVPNTQLFWPELGAAVKARRWTRTSPKVELLSPVTQAVVLYVLNQKTAEPCTPKLLAEKLGYSAMSMTRALNELEANQLGVVSREGKERYLTFPDGLRALWLNALPYLRSPVREELHIHEADIAQGMFFVAGESALSVGSLLASPNEPVFAVDANTWKSTAKNIQIIPIKDVGTCLIQVWRYDPKPYACDNKVDDFSLYLSLRQHHDERVNIALDELLENRKW